MLQRSWLLPLLLVFGVSAAPGNCPVGYYCAQGTGITGLPCPVGTFSNTTGLTTASLCTNCTAGTYCDVSVRELAVLLNTLSASLKEVSIAGLFTVEYCT